MMSYAIYSVAACARNIWVKCLFGCIFVTLAGCSALPDKPVRASQYDFGPGVVAAQPAVQQAALPALAIDDIGVSGSALDSQAVQYRLAYQNPQELHPYTLARWTAPPAQLVRQRLRERLGQSRPIFEARGSLALSRSQNAVRPLLLRLDLEEFSQVFTSPQASAGLLRLRATLIEQSNTGEKLVAQRSIVVQQPATSADAQGGVRALTQAADAAIGEIEAWLQQSTPR